MAPVVGHGWRRPRGAPRHDRRVDGGGARAQRAAARRRASGSRASASTSAGTSRRSSARCLGDVSAILEVYGLDAAAAAAFLALLWPRLRRRQAIAVGVAAAVVATALTPVLMPGVPVLVAAVVAVAVGWTNVRGPRIMTMWTAAGGVASSRAWR
jgi:hypothetical protein